MLPQIGSGGQTEGLLWIEQAFTDAGIFFSCDTHTVCNSICLDFNCKRGGLQWTVWSWRQPYLWFFLQSDVHPTVARQSSLLHSMMPEVIIISKNLHKHKGRDYFTCSKSVAGQHSVLTKACMCKHEPTCRQPTVLLDNRASHLLNIIKRECFLWNDW